MSPELLTLLVRLLLAALLYVFLGAILLAVLREIRQAAAPAATRPRPLGRIVVVDPAALPDGSEPILPAAFPLLPRTTFGRAPSNHVVLPDDTVSAQHAALYQHGAHWLLEDCGSRNGTRLNGLPLETPTVITPEDTFQIGRVTFRVEFDAGQKEI